MPQDARNHTNGTLAAASTLCRVCKRGADGGRAGETGLSVALVGPVPPAEDTACRFVGALARLGLLAGIAREAGLLETTEREGVIGMR